MTAIFCKPESATIVEGSAQSLRPIANLFLDQPAMVWRSNGLSAAYIVVQPDRDFDLIALVGSNLRSNDTVRFRVANSVAGLTAAPSIDVTMSAMLGVQVEGGSTKTILALDQMMSGYLRIDIMATGHPDGFVQAQRLVVGRSVRHDGIDNGCEQSWIDQSPVQSGPNWLAFDEYPSLAQWKIKTSWITDTQYREKWANFLAVTGIRKGWLFVPVLEDQSRHQIEAIFGTTVSSAVAQHPDWNNWTLDITVRSLAP